MTHVDSRVRGSHTVTLVPERATVRAGISKDGPEVEPEATFTDFEELARWGAWTDGRDRANVGGSPELTLHPEDVQISAEVEAHNTIHTPR